MVWEANTLQGGRATPEVPRLEAGRGPPPAAHTSLPSPPEPISQREKQSKLRPWLQLPLPTGELLTASCGVKAGPLGTGPGFPLISQGSAAKRFHKVYPNTHMWGFSLLRKSSHGSCGNRLPFSPSTESLLGLGSLGTTTSRRRRQERTQLQLLCDL